MPYEIIFQNLLLDNFTLLSILHASMHELPFQAKVHALYEGAIVKKNPQVLRSQSNQVPVLPISSESTNLRKQQHNDTMLVSFETRKTVDLTALKKTANKHS